MKNIRLKVKKKIKKEMAKRGMVKYPVSVTLALSNVCNYNCPICSIQRFKGEKRVYNNMPLEIIMSYKKLLENIDNITFMGRIGESILNPQFCEIIKYIRTVNKDISMCISTNGYGLTEKIQDAMIENEFDKILWSMHAAKAETYKLLQGDFYDRVINNMTLLAKKKDKKPYIEIEYALNKLNIEEAPEMLDIARATRCETINYYHYNDYGWKDINLDDDYEMANRKIDVIWESAKEKQCLDLIREKPYYVERKMIENLSDYGTEPCYLPWTGLQMRSSCWSRDSLYIGCCNVFNIFLFNYVEHYNSCGEIDFDSIWNHPILKYLRLTVNEKNGCKRNPLCAYCKSQKRRYYKHVDNDMNYKIKLEKIEEFFTEFDKWLEEDLGVVPGLEVLYTEDEELRAESVIG